MVVKAIEEISQVARQNLSSSEQLSTTTTTLLQEAEGLWQASTSFQV